MYLWLCPPSWRLFINRTPKAKSKPKFVYYKVSMANKDHYYSGALTIQGAFLPVLGKSTIELK